MPLFYTPTKSDQIIELSQEESRHLSKVLRLKNGDFAEVIDGKGNLYQCRVVDNHPKKAVLEIENSRYTPSEFGVHIAAAPTKNLNRWEWFLEKACEVGIDRISPILTANAERKILKPERQERILISAIKQSLKATLPKLDELKPLGNLISENFEGKKYIAHCHPATSKMHLKKIHPKGEKALILIGSEGDFSSDEILAAEAKGFQPISLGSSRLRTETAALLACHIINLINQDE